MLECVVNVSEGRRVGVLDELAAACGSALLDLHADADHHRSVLTMAGDAAELRAACERLEAVAMRRIDIAHHEGVHPRLGAVDVVPFVALGGTSKASAIEIARAHAASLAERLAVPTFLYGAADPRGRSLPEVRREAFRTRPPDFGPGEPHPTFGATAVGVRPVLVAVNCELAGPDLAGASKVAGAVRESGGGLPGVRALAFPIESRALVQVSMNLVALEQTGLERAVTAVRELASEVGLEATGVELVGLVPRAELARCSPSFLSWAGIDDDRTIEARLKRGAPR